MSNFIKKLLPPENWRLPVVILLGVIIGLGLYILRISNAVSYLSDNPETCINCHVMNPQYATWNHSVAFTMETYDPAMKISDYGAKRVQENCMSCHGSLASIITENADKYHSFDEPYVENGRKCWDCHKSVPHGKVRSVTSTPYNLGVKESNLNK